MSDHLIYEDAVSTELYTTSEFTQKQYLYVNDNNNGSYSSQIVLDTTSLSNSGNYIGWSEAFILMPLLIQFQSVAGANTSAAAFPNAGIYDWTVGMKNGYWQMIHSMTVEFNNRNIVQQVPFLNVFCSFKAMTTWSQEDLVNWGSVCGFYPDTADSWIYNNIANVNPLTVNLLNTSGTGISNNRTCPYVSMNAFLTSVGAQTVTATGGAIPASFNLTTKCTVPNTSVRQSYNVGLQTRQSWINYNPTYAATATGTLPPFVQVLSTIADATTGSGYVGSFTQQFIPNNQQLINGAASYTTLFQAEILGQGTANRTIQIPAILRLKDLCNFFEKVPLLKGSTMRIYLNTNQCQFQAQYIGGQLLQTTAIAGTPGTIAQINYGAISMATAPQMLGGGATNPLMLASNDLGQGGYNVAPLNLADGSPVGGAINNIAPNYALLNIGVSIARTQFSSLTTASAPITQCRLYAPAYTMNPLAETRLLELSPTKKILYDDIFQFYFPNQSAGANINILVSNGIPNIKQVIVVPFLSASGVSANGPTPIPPATTLPQYGVSVATVDTLVGAAPVVTSTLLSPFSTAGATPDPIQLGNFQILISGNVLFQQQLQYSFEDFYEQMVSINQLNGGATTGLASGLIGLKEWNYLYRYYVGNASRILPSEEGMARSVQLQCINQSAVAIDLMCFIVYEKAITVNMSTGQEIA
jgi:hypothetical protein